MIQHPELDGPFSVPSAWTTVSDPMSGQPVQVPTAWAANRWNTTPSFYASHSAALSAYKVAPTPFSRVWSGDNPDSPQATVALAFPDVGTAEMVLLTCGATEP